MTILESLEKGIHGGITKSFNDEVMENIKKKAPKLLKMWSYNDQEIKEILEIIPHLKFEYNGEYVELYKAKDICGYGNLLAGISRATYHWSGTCNTRHKDKYLYVEVKK